MEEENIGSRLKIFMDSLGLTSSQFADKALIPRPTFSQLLSGRNKKVSDEIIRKVHEAFPELSITWLMFGEDEMMKNRPAPREYPVSVDDSSQDATGCLLTDGDLFSVDDSEISEFPITDAKKTVQSNLTEKKTAASQAYCVDNETVEAVKLLKTLALEQQENAKKCRRVVRITVFYDDSSYESFSPMGE